MDASNLTLVVLRYFYVLALINMELGENCVAEQIPYREETHTKNEKTTSGKRAREENYLNYNFWYSVEDV